MECRNCGSEVTGKFCAQCGAPAAGGKDPGCPDCGAAVEPEDYFCGECGVPLRERPEKPTRAYLPWILSAAALVAFAVGAAVLVQDQAQPRAPGEPMTGGVIEGEGPPGDVPPAGVEGTPPDAGFGPGEGPMDLSPREAVDRLYNRAMSEAEAGDTAGAAFFAEMGLEAYGQVNPAEVDADLLYHVGMLHLVAASEDPAGPEAGSQRALSVAREILERREDHLLGLLLESRAARVAGDEDAAARVLERLRQAAAEQGIDARPEYEAHRAELEAALDDR